MRTFGAPTAIDRAVVEGLVARGNVWLHPESPEKTVAWTRRRRFVSIGAANDEKRDRTGKVVPGHPPVRTSSRDFMAKPLILYLNTDPGARIPEMTLAGIRRYAGIRGWEAEAFSSEQSRREAIPALLASRAPVAGCIYECSDDNIAPPSAFRGVPVVYLHARKAPRGAHAARIPTDNAAVAVAAFRELSLGRPAAYAVVGVPEAFEWSFVRVRRFCEETRKAERLCSAFPWIEGETSSARSGRLASWVGSLPRKTAVFAVNDLVAAEVVAAARAAFRSIPHELTLLGVDNLPEICEASTPAISSIEIDYERAGYVAAKRIGEGAATPSSSIGPLMAVRRRSTGGRGRREAFILEAVEMIRRKACDGLTAAALAKRFPCSRNLFDLRFREAVGRSALDEILHVRLEKACTLLEKTDTPISLIPGLCGFRTHTAIDRLFRSRFGMSMRDWRRKNA